MTSRNAAVPIRADPMEWVGYAGLYVPALLAWVLVSAPILSYAVAWLGSGWILWLSMTGRVRPLPGDRTWDEQLFRPLFLTQGMFAGYYCLSSVFYVWEFLAMGGGVSVPHAGADIEYVAAAQRYAVLGHAALVHGILATMDYRRSGEWKLSLQIPLPRLILAVGIGTLALGFVLGMIPGFDQFIGKLHLLTGAASVLGFAYALRRGDKLVSIFGGMAYAWVLFESLLSGWKERTILVLGILLISLYPKYKRTVTVAGIGALLFVISVLPAYNSTFRQLNWDQGVAAEQAAEQAIKHIETGQVDLGETTWDFLTGRLTLIDQAAQYVEHTPEHRPYYGLSIVEQGVQSVIPRAFWPAKPITEQVVMNRVYENEVVRRTSAASAKPSIIADGYLSGGAFGVLLACFLLGCVAGWGSRYAERWFGGYEIGGQVVYLGLFSAQLLTASVEFLMNSLFWSFMLMGLLAFGLWLAGLLRWSGERTPSLSSAAVPARRG